MHDLLPVILPNGKGWLLVYSIFADETYGKETGHVIVAGYLIGSNALERLTEKWKLTLEQGALSYFHMKEGHHRSHPDTYAALADIITHEFVIAGFVVSVLKHEFDAFSSRKVLGHRGKSELPLKYWLGGSYSFCTGALVQLANQWLDNNNPEEKDVAYVFDAGNEKQDEAGMFFKMIATDKFLADRKRALRFYSYSFVDGKRSDSGALQAADMLAWNLAYRQRTKQWDAIGARIIDSVSVVGVHYSPDGLQHTIRQQEQFWQEYGSLKRANIIHPREDIMEA